LVLDNKIHTLRFKRFPSVDEVAEKVKFLNEHGVTHRLWIFEQGLDLKSSDVKHLLEIFGSDKLPTSDSKVALVSKTDSGFGIARMYATYAERRTNAYQTFRDENDAMIWLLEEKAVHT